MTSIQNRVTLVWYGARPSQNQLLQGNSSQQMTFRALQHAHCLLVWKTTCKFPLHFGGHIPHCFSLWLNCLSASASSSVSFTLMKLSMNISVFHRWPELWVQVSQRSLWTILQEASPGSRHVPDSQRNVLLFMLQSDLDLWQSHDSACGQSAASRRCSSPPTHDNCDHYFAVCTCRKLM